MMEKTDEQVRWAAFWEDFSVLAAMDLFQKSQQDWACAKYRFPESLKVAQLPRCEIYFQDTLLPGRYLSMSLRDRSTSVIPAKCQDAVISHSTRLDVSQSRCDRKPKEKNYLAMRTQGGNNHLLK